MKSAHILRKLISGLIYKPFLSRLTLIIFLFSPSASASELLSESRSAGTATDRQRISGSIYDIESLEPLAGASVYSLSGDNGTSTDPSGLFEFDNLVGTDFELVISHIGYRSYTYSVKSLQPGETFPDQAVIGRHTCGK